MAKAVRFDHYGDRNVLKVVDVEIPEAAAGEVLVEVRPPGSTPVRSRSVRCCSTSGSRRPSPPARAATSPGWSAPSARCQ